MEQKACRKQNNSALDSADDDVGSYLSDHDFKGRGGHGQQIFIGTTFAFTGQGKAGQQHHRHGQDDGQKSGHNVVLRNKHGLKRYRYYVSTKAIKHGYQSTDIKSVSAEQIEPLIVGEIILRGSGCVGRRRDKVFAASVALEADRYMESDRSVWIGDDLTALLDWQRVTMRDGCQRFAHTVPRFRWVEK